MSRFSRLSIWENSAQHMSWYDHAVGRKTPAEPFVTTNTALSGIPEEEAELTTGNPCQELGYQDGWFSELKSQDLKKKYGSAIKIAHVRSNSIESVLLDIQNKPLPANPYFEYLFADADVDTGFGDSIDGLSWGKESSDKDYLTGSDLDLFELQSPPESQPGTPEPESQEPHVTEVSRFSSSSSEDSSIHIITRALHDNHISKTGTIISQDQQQVKKRRILIPRSQKARCSNIHKSNVSNAVIGKSARQMSFSYSLETATVALKRKSAALSEGQDSELPNGQSYPNKKKCVIFRGSRSAAAFERCARIRATYRHFSIFSAVSSRTNSSHQASSDFFTHKPLAIAPKGYAGQFDGMVIKHNFVPDFKFNLTSLDLYKSGVHYTFGDRRHPNGLFTHTSISVDPFGESLDFTEKNLPTGHPLFTCMNFATDMTDAASHNNVVKLRNHDEEILRRESHIECAHARLEGVSVGYYRYYQGHLSIEEYHDAEMCIC